MYKQPIYKPISIKKPCIGNWSTCNTKKVNMMAIKRNNFAGRIKYLSYQVISNRIMEHFTVHLNDLRQYA